MTIRARAGMTLMELVIGLAITGLMAAAGAGAFSSIIDHRRVIRDASTVTERTAALRETIRSWVLSGDVRIQMGGIPRGLNQGAARTTTTNGRGAPGTGTLGVAAVTPAKAAGDELTVGAVTALNPSMLPNVTLRLYVDADENTPETGLTVEYQPTPQQGLVRRMLDSTIDVLTVEYLDQRTNRWIASTQAATLGSPRAVRVTMSSSANPKRAALLGVPLVFVTRARTVIN